MSENHTEKFAYLKVDTLKDRWSNRAINGLLKAKKNFRNS